MDEWDWESNEKINFDPSKITLGSSKKPYWICQYGHRWRTIISHRLNGTQCPYCSGRLAIPGETDLATINPLLASEWHPTKNGALAPSNVKPYSNKKVWWMCDKGHEYEMTINNRSHGENCPMCWGERHTSFPEQAILFYLSKYFAVKSREDVCGVEVDIYIPNMNLGIEYDGEYFHSSDDARRKELEKDDILQKNGIELIRIKESSDNFIYDQTIYYVYNTKSSNLKWVILSLFNILGSTIDESIIDIDKDRGQIYSLYICMEKEQSLAVKYPELSKEWNYDKNGRLAPEMVRPASNKIVWWICNKNHEWQASIANRTNGNNCPYCSGSKVLSGYNDLQTEYLEGAKQTEMELRCEYEAYIWDKL